MSKTKRLRCHWWPSHWWWNCGNAKEWHHCIVLVSLQVRQKGNRFVRKESLICARATVTSGISCSTSPFSFVRAFLSSKLCTNTIFAMDEEIYGWEQGDAASSSSKPWRSDLVFLWMYTSMNTFRGNWQNFYLKLKYPHLMVMISCSSILRRICTRACANRVSFRLSEIFGRLDVSTAYPLLLPTTNHDKSHPYQDAIAEAHQKGSIDYPYRLQCPLVYNHWVQVQSKARPPWHCRTVAVSRTLRTLSRTNQSGDYWGKNPINLIPGSHFGPSPNPFPNTSRYWVKNGRPNNFGFLLGWPNFHVTKRHFIGSKTADIGEARYHTLRNSSNHHARLIIADSLLDICRSSAVAPAFESSS
jgi:hypothetical protein